MTESSSVFEFCVLDDYAWVNVRAGPQMNAVKLGQKRRGELVAVDLRGGIDHNWVRTVEKFGDLEQAGWLLIDGTPQGLGVLLRLAGAPLPPCEPLPPIATNADRHAFELESPTEYKVVHTLVKVRIVAVLASASAALSGARVVFLSRGSHA